MKRFHVLSWKILPVFTVILVIWVGSSTGAALRRDERGLSDTFQQLGTKAKDAFHRMKGEAKDFFQQYGWLPKFNPETFKEATEAKIRKAIRKFQRFFGLPVTGEVDEQTETLIKSPRCGVEDNFEDTDIEEDANATLARRKRYVIQQSVLLGQKWKTRDLKYRINKYTPKLDQATVDGVFRKAFFEWQKSGPFKITLKPDGPVHVDIRFDYGDGVGKALAYAYGPGPGVGGDMRFDEYEQWTVRSGSGQNLYMVALHEIGHVFGLDHSGTRGAIMNPYYTGYIQGKSLQPDDIAGFQSIYGPPLAQSAPPPAPSPAKVRADESGSERRDKLTGIYGDVCHSPEGTKVTDGVTITADKRIYAFRGRHFFELKAEGRGSQLQPELITTGWPGLPESIDTVFTGPEGNTFFFKGDQYYKFRNREMSPGYPKPISQGFPGVPSNLDTVFVYNPNKKIYFIKGDQYYRFESGGERRVADGYPKSLTEWKKLPSKIDAAIMWRDGKTYFFSGKNYYKFNDLKFAVEEGYPKPTASWWFACKETNPQIPDGSVDEAVETPAA